MEPAIQWLSLIFNGGLSVTCEGTRKPCITGYVANILIFQDSSSLVVHYTPSHFLWCRSFIKEKLWLGMPGLTEERNQPCIRKNMPVPLPCREESLRKVSFFSLISGWHYLRATRDEIFYESYNVREFIFWKLFSKS